MRRLLAIISLGFLLSPTLASADDAPPPQPTAQMRAAMEQARTQMEQLHAAARNQMLGSLSLAHRTAVANIVGQMAVSPTPNWALAAKQIDAVLSQAEGAAILRTHAAARTQMRTLQTQMRAQFEASLTPEQKAQMDARHAQFQQQHPNGMQRPERAMSADPGEILLRSLTPRGGGMERPMHAPGGPGMGGPGGGPGMGAPPPA
jgi:hypothetical protein